MQIPDSAAPRVEAASPSGSACGCAPPPAWWVIPGSLALLCFLLSYHQLLGISRDYPEYEAFWNALRDEGLSSALTSRFEPGFTYVCWILTLVLTSNFALHGVLSACSIFAKMTAVRALAVGTAPVLIAAIFYGFRFLPLHELTQVRGSLALAALAAAFALRWSGHRWIALALCFVALPLHLSSVFIAPFVSFSFARRRHVLVTAIAAFALARFGLPWAIQALSGDIGVLALYELDEFTAPNPFSAVLLVDASVIVVGFFMWRSLPDSMKHVLLVQCVGIALFWATLDQPVFAHRLREAFAVFWTFYVASAFAHGGELRTVSVLFTVASSAGHVYLYWLNPAEPFFN